MLAVITLNSDKSFQFLDVNTKGVDVDGRGRGD
jgi:hypothetical protein